MAPAFTPGDRVIDQDGDDPDTAAVVATPDAIADEWNVEGGAIRDRVTEAVAEVVR